MKIKTSVLAFFLLCLLARFNLICGQGESLPQETIIGSRIKNPIVIDVRSDEKNIYFNVINNSYFPYNFEVKFGEFRNLSPRAFEKKTVLMPGINRLYSFKIVEPNEPPVLGYKTSYFMAATNYKGEMFKEYLIPVGKNKTVEFQTRTENGIITSYVNQFKMNSGDTVFNSRKGTVTALPDNRTEVDRIIKENSLEVRHQDGTIAIYMGVNPENKFVKLGQDVYPGQPIGIIDESNLLKFEIFEIRDAGLVKTIDVYYSGSDDKIYNSKMIQGMKVVSPDKTIRKEMSKREITRLEKHSLY
jgi:hypothetical protein